MTNWKLSIAVGGALLLFSAASAPAQAAPAQTDSPAWSASTNTSGCPSSMRLLTPNRSADYFAAHPDELLASHHPDGVAAPLHQQLAKLAGHHIHYLTAVTCKPGHQRGPATPIKASATAATSANWSGYQSSSRGNFIGAFMAWNVPSVSTAANSSAYSSVWPGIGQGYSAADSLVQDGTEQDVSCVLSVCTHDYYPWYEVVPEEAQQEITNLTVSAGDAIESFIEYEPPDGLAYFEVDNITTNTGVYGYEYTTTAFTGTGSTAEWIVERTQVNGKYPALANFGSVPVTVAIAAQGSSWEDTNLSYPGAADNSPSAISMTSCSGSATLARPGAIAADGTDFTVTFVQRGSSETC
ncbi:G1 family glutamic endopeptidase [Actinoplanes sp. NPDC026619]|uniref:G1 family glutamic endopeptidase n=1 Tax=Actinoplanes sp. NPDC026619 TaxID=3155798 RepID=UPI0033DF0113